MMGAIGAWLYTDVAGISQMDDSSGFESLLLWPRVTVHENLPSASSSFHSIRGMISLAWTNATTVFTIDATVPVNTVAQVRLPFPCGTDINSLAASEGGTSIFAGGKYIPGVNGVTAAAPTVTTYACYLSVSTGAGSYALQLSGW